MPHQPSLATPTLPPPGRTVNRNERLLNSPAGHPAPGLKAPLPPPLVTSDQ